MDNFLAKHAVDQFSTSGQEGFQDMGSFHRASAGVGIDVAKESAEHEKFSVLKFKQNRNALDEDNRRSKSNLDLIAALDENDEKNREHDILHRLKARRQSLQVCTAAAASERASFLHVLPRTAILCWSLSPLSSTY